MKLITHEPSRQRSAYHAGTHFSLPSRRSAATAAVTLFALAATVGAGTLLVGCGSGAVQTLAAASPVGYSRVVVNVDWPTAAARAKSTRHISQFARQLLIEVVRPKASTTAPGGVDYDVIYSQILVRPEQGGAQTAVFPNVPNRSDLQMRASAWEGQPNASTQLGVVSPITIFPQGVTTTTGAASISLSLASTATNIDLVAVPVGVQPTQAVSPNGVPINLPSLFSVKATDGAGNIIPLDPQELATIHLTTSDNTNYPVTLDTSTGIATVTANNRNLTSFTVSGTFVATAAIGPTTNVGISKTLTPAAKVTVTPDVSVFPDSASNAYPRAQTQPLSIDFTTSDFGSGTPTVQVFRLDAPTGAGAAKYNVTGAYDYTALKKLVKNSDVLTQIIPPSKVSVAVNDLVAGIPKLAFRPVASQIHLSNGSLVDAGTADAPVLYQIVITSADGTGRGIVPVLVNGSASITIKPPTGFTGTIYKNSAAQVFTVLGSDGLPVTDATLTLASVPSGAATPPVITSNTVTTSASTSDGLYELTATQPASGSTATLKFTVPAVTLSLQNGKGFLISNGKYAVSTGTTTFTAIVNGLDPNRPQPSLVWTLSAGSVPISIGGITDTLSSSGNTATYKLPSSILNSADQISANTASVNFSTLLSAKSTITVTDSSNYGLNVPFTVSIDAGSVSATIK